MKDESIPIKRALLSVTDKTGICDFAQNLLAIDPQIEIIASGGTAKTLEQKNIPYTPLSQYTGFPECFDGRVKTLHPLIAGGILMRKGKDEEEGKTLGIFSIDLIVCNLYDFAKACTEDTIATETLMESMDIGGSTLIRSSCKNYLSTALLTDPADYAPFLKELKEHKGSITLATREALAVKGMNLSANYETLLAKVLTKKLSHEHTERPILRQGKELRYGENPDQQAWVFNFNEQQGLTNAKILSGKELSYNNYEDASIAYHAAQELLQLNTAHGFAIIKHGSLSSYATGNTLAKAFQLAWEGDAKSAFGSVIASISPITEKLTEEIANKFIEVIIAPAFDEAFVSWARSKKPNLRLLEMENNCTSPLMYQQITGGMLVQTRKKTFLSAPIESLIVTKKKPNLKQKGLFIFGVCAVNFAKSNAVAIVREVEENSYQLLGIGVGQPNRIDSLERLAIPKAIENLKKEHEGDTHYDPKKDLEKCVLVSDGFFPFDDSVRSLAKYGIKCCIQPGGGKRDQEVIAAADELGLSMIFTGERYFSH